MSSPTRLGAFPDADGVAFSLWTTTARRCAVRVLDHDGGPARTHALEDLGDGLHATHVAGLAAGATYRFVLDGEEVDDPYARCLPAGVDGPAVVHDPTHAWRHPPVARPLAEHVIYELHVGAFTPEGTFAAARGRLAELAELGVTAVELMPVVSFPGRRGWGYDGVALFAPHDAYGTPDELRALIDAAHGLGLAVIVDVVYNHFGPAGNLLPRYSPAYLTREHATPWGEAPDFRVPWMRRYVLDNVRMWIEDYRVDGLRLDAVHGIVNPSPRPILREVADLVAAAGRPIALIAEDDRNRPALVEREGLDAIWADDFHHAVHVVLTGEQDGYYEAYPPSLAAIARAIARGWLFEGERFLDRGPRGAAADRLPAEAFVYCLQNHDQVGNRALGNRLGASISLDAYCAASTLLLFLPMTPLLFMGQEWAASTPFLYFTDHAPELGAQITRGRREELARFRAFADPAAREAIPDPQAETTFTRSRLDRDEQARPPHARVLALYRALLALRRADPVLRSTGRAELTAGIEDDLLVVRRGRGAARRSLVANLDGRARVVDPAGAPVLVASGPIPAWPELPPWSAVVLGAP